MKRLLSILIAAIILLPNLLQAQGIWKTYTRADGLAGDSVTCITQDNFGNYWIGSRKAGLSKLDTNGIWTTYFTRDIFDEFYKPSIWDIEIDSLNNKWLQHSGMYVVKFDDSSYTYYNPSGTPTLEPSPICLGQDSSGHIWCGTTNALAYWFDGVDWHSVYVRGAASHSFVNEIKTDRHGKLYFAHDRGISTLEAFPFYGWPAFDIVFDNQNRMWFTTASWMWGLGMFDGDEWYAYTTEDGLLDSRLWAVAIDSSNNIWFSYASSLYGVTKFNGNQFYHYYQEDGLASPKVWDIYVDRKGDIWFGTTAGVSVLHDTTSTSVKEIAKPDNLIETFTLFQNYPNPFNNNTLIKYNLITNSIVKLSIYNLTGKEVITLVNKSKKAGEHQVLWDGKDNRRKEVSSGIYLAVLKTSKSKELIKLSLIR